MAAIDLDAFQLVVGIWGGVNGGDTLTDLISLVEETGQVCRAVLKREGGDSRSDDWNGEIRREVVHVFINLLAIAHREGFSLAQALADEWQRKQEAEHERGLHDDPERKEIVAKILAIEALPPDPDRKTEWQALNLELARYDSERRP